MPYRWCLSMSFVLSVTYLIVYEYFQLEGGYKTTCVYSSFVLWKNKSNFSLTNLRNQTAGYRRQWRMPMNIARYSVKPNLKFNCVYVYYLIYLRILFFKNLISVVLQSVTMRRLQRIKSSGENMLIHVQCICVCQGSILSPLFLVWYINDRVLLITVMLQHTETWCNWQINWCSCCWIARNLYMCRWSEANIVLICKTCN